MREKREGMGGVWGGEREKVYVGMGVGEEVGGGLVGVGGVMVEGGVGGGV